MKSFLYAFLLSAATLYSQSTVTLNGTTYTLNGHPRTLIDGPGGVIDTRIKDPDGAGPLKAPKAVSSNPAWVALQTAVTAALPGYQVLGQGYYMRDGSVAMEFASYWYADNSQTAAHDAALYMLNNIETYLPLVCVESQLECVNGGSGYAITSYGVAYWIPNWMLAYELMRGEMTPAQRQLFASKMLNDVSLWGGVDGAPGTTCTNPTTAAGTAVLANPVFSANDGTLVSLVFTNNVLATATITGSTQGMKPGDQVTIHATTGNGLGQNVYVVISINGPNSFSFGYTPSNPNGNQISPGMYIVYKITAVTASAPVFGTSINVGDWIFTPTNYYNLGIVTTIVDSTHALLTGDIGPTNGSDLLYYRPQHWSPGQCGFIWHVKHDEWTPQVLTYSNGQTLYPPNGGVNGTDTGHNLVYAALWGIHMTFLSVMDDDANAPQRSDLGLATAFNFWYGGPYALARRFWTGFHQSGSGYGDRLHWMMPGVAIAMQNSLLSAPDLMAGGWAKNVMTSFYANTFPDSQRSGMQWGQPDVSGSNMIAQTLLGAPILAYWFRNTPEGQYTNWWMQNLWAASGTGFGNVPGANLGFTAANITGTSPAWFYIFSDQAFPTLSLATAPTTFPMNVSDTGTVGVRADALISRTGYASVTDTLINFHAESIPEFDHNVFAGQPSNYGSYKIFKGDYLLAEDYNLNMNDPADAGFTIGGQGSNYVEVGGTDANLVVYNFPTQAGMPRATGTNSFAYAMADVTGVYVPAVGLQHGYRHLLDFKKPGTQQFVIDYVDFKTAAGKTKKAYYHYPNMATTSLSGTTVTSNNPNYVPSQLLTQVLAPQPVLIATNTSGTSFRLDVCPTLNNTTCDATNTQAEMMVIHMPAAGSTNTLPPLEQLATVDPNFRGVEIDGTSPKVAVFARNGMTYTSASFTAAHTGTAQILIAGITPTASSGLLYSLLLNGTQVLTANTVGPDGTIYYEGPPGAYQVAAITAPPIPGGAALSEAFQYQTYSQPLPVVGGSPPLTWTVTSGALPAGLTLDPSLGVISGIPTGSGTAAFTVKITDALGQTGSQSYSLLVGPAAPLTITSSSLVYAWTGVSFSETLMAAGAGGSYLWSVVSGSLPGGLSLNANGVISGVPAATGMVYLTVQAQDAFGNSASLPLRFISQVLPSTNISGVAVSGVSMLP